VHSGAGIGAGKGTGAGSGTRADVMAPTSNLDMDLHSRVSASRAMPPQPHSAMERESSTASRTCTRDARQGKGRDRVRERGQESGLEGRVRDRHSLNAGVVRVHAQNA